MADGTGSSVRFFLVPELIPCRSWMADDTGCIFFVHRERRALDSSAPGGVPLRVTRDLVRQPAW